MSEDPESGELVMLRADAGERGERERQILHLLERGEQEIAHGEGYDLDDVMAEADAILTEDAP